MTSRAEAFLGDLVLGAFHFFFASVDDRHDVDNEGSSYYDGHGHRSLAGGGDDEHGDDDHSSFGVHITYEDLYASVIFFTTIYVAGVLTAKFLKMPCLVGEIFAGILLGPPVADYVPNPEAFVMLGEIGLILLVLEAGIDIDLTTLKLIGARGAIIAIIGSILPIAFGIGLAFAIGTDSKGSIAAGAAFGPTSLGIAMNILRQGKIVNTPVGQLVVSAAVIDDMIALVILSQLSALSGDVTASGIIIPIVSAIGFLILGGYIAINVLPDLLGKFILDKVPEESRARASLAIMMGLLIGMMPATYYAEASFLMGAFVSGLTFCRDHSLHHLFVSQFKRLLQWLMRIFFAASIGFQVPIKDFGDGTVIWQGLLFTLALLGKLAVGFLVPNFNNTKKFRGLHLRDCLITGFSMAAEGEFAFVIAVFAVDEELISKDLYASVVLAVLFSTIVPPFLLRFTISYFNKKSEAAVKKAAALEFDRKMDLEGDLEHQLTEGIKNQTTVFLCIQSQCATKWGLLPRLMSTLAAMNLEVIDHRSWHPRGVDSTLVTEMFVQDTINSEQGDAAAALDQRIEEVQETMLKAIQQPDAKVKVTRWFPGVLQEITEEVESGTDRPKKSAKRLSVAERVAKEAAKALESTRDKQLNATREKTVAEILGEVTIPEPKMGGAPEASAPKRGRRVRQKMRSTPVVGGSLFDEPENAEKITQKAMEDMRKPSTRHGFGAAETPSGIMADLIVGDEVFKIRVSPQTLARIRRGYSGGLVDDEGIQFAAEDIPLEQRLMGFVRTNATLTRIDEDDASASQVSEHESVDAAHNGEGENWVDNNGVQG